MELPSKFIGHCCELNHFRKGLSPIEVYSKKNYLMDGCFCHNYCY